MSKDKAERISSLEYYHMTRIGKTKHTSERGLSIELNERAQKERVGSTFLSNFYHSSFLPTDLDVCFSSPCQNAGTCHNAGAGQFMCLCPAIFRGITCEGNITKTFLKCLWHQRAYIFHLSLVFPLLYVRVRPPPVSERLPFDTTDPKHLKFSSQSSMIKDHLSLATAITLGCYGCVIFGHDF